jgi:hypothetical protein
MCFRRLAVQRVLAKFSVELRAAFFHIRMRTRRCRPPLVYSARASSGQPGMAISLILNSRQQWRLARPPR